MSLAGDFKNQVARAYDRIKDEARRTSLEYSAPLSERWGARVYLKWESEQLTGSFKFRGALNKLRALSAEERRRGVVSASTGNHGLGISLAANKVGVGLTLVLPADAAPLKKERLKEQDVRVIEFEGSCEKAELWARHLAMERGRVYVSPYNDEDVIAGQGTIGLEIAEDLPAVQDVIVPVGGGGLAAGIAGYLKAIKPELRAFGVEPLHSAFLAASIEAGKIVTIEEKETIAEAVAGGIEPGSITFPLCRELIDGIIIVEEPLIGRAMSLIHKAHHRVVEGAGALALAGLMKESDRFRGRDVVLIISGGNISAEAFNAAAATD